MEVAGYTGSQAESIIRCVNVVSLRHVNGASHDPMPVHARSAQTVPVPEESASVFKNNFGGREAITRLYGESPPAAHRRVRGVQHHLPVLAALRPYLRETI